MTFDLALVTIIGLLMLVTGAVCFLGAQIGDGIVAQKRSIRIAVRTSSLHQVGTLTVSRYNDTVSIAIGDLEATMTMEEWDNIVKAVKEL